MDSKYKHTDDAKEYITGFPTNQPSYWAEALHGIKEAGEDSDDLITIISNQIADAINQ